MGIKYKHLSDPLFLFSLTLYSINKWVFLKFEIWSCNFCTYYLNDLLLVPVLVPIILFFSGALKLRDVSSPPMFLEIIIPLAIWSIAFELIGPFYFGKGTSDPLDVFAYCLGGLISWLIWNQGNVSDYLINTKWSIKRLVQYKKSNSADAKTRVAD
jgi:hypothetical protein